MAGIVLAMMIICGMIVLTSIRLGAKQPEGIAPPDTRTFIFVRDLITPRNVMGAQIVATRMTDKEQWPFPLTNLGGWTKRQIPDGVYLVSVVADGYEPRLLRITVPTKGKFPHRTFEAFLEPKR
jgi:hypothetical protein